MDILDDIYKYLEFCYEVFFFEYVVFYEKFIIKFFLLNILKYFGDDYDKIVLKVFCLNNKNIFLVLEKSNCIMIKLGSCCKFFNELVYLSFVILGIFLVEDERFFLDLFCKDKDLDVFVNFGMMKNKIFFDFLKL